MNCVVIDDEPLARKGMQMLIEQVPGLHLSGMFSSARQAKAFLDANHVDLIFLDIQMPVKNGMEFLKEDRSPAKVIITTAYPQFAVDAFELEVADYLVKPIRLERFSKAVSRVSTGRREQVMSDPDDDYVFIRSERRYVRTRFSEIDYIEGLKDYAIIHCGNEKHAVASNLRTIHDTLPGTVFLRVNKSYIVNMSKVRVIENDALLVNSKRIPIGDNYRRHVLDFVNMRKVIRRPEKNG
jgi:DNA-binding LytR/AlgR family response regulator